MSKSVMMISVKSVPVVAILVVALILFQFCHAPQVPMVAQSIFDFSFAPADYNFFTFSSSSPSSSTTIIDEDDIEEESSLVLFETCENCTLDEWLGRYYASQPIENGEIGHFHFERNVWMTTKNISQVITESNGTLLPLNEQQYGLLFNNNNNNDSEMFFNRTIEEERCHRYGFGFDTNRTSRRRIFYGATIADDSYYTLQTIATEDYDIFHTAAFVESNTTHTRTNRTLRFPPGSDRKKLLKSMFGTNTKVSVDYFVDSFRAQDSEGHNKFNWQHMQKEAILYRWKRNGMRPEDVGILADVDEFFSRDFLRALQSCDVPQFRPNQDCQDSKLVGYSMGFESSPECYKERFRWWHPDAMIGECIEHIGNATLHKPPERTWMGQYSFRKTDHGRWKNWTGYLNKYNANNITTKDENGRQMYALWSGTDFRAAAGSANGGNRPKPIEGERRMSTGYHCHNFFESSQDLRHKYTTYGEPKTRAKHAPLSLINRALSIAVACSHGWPHPFPAESFQDYSPTLDGIGPIFFENPDIRQYRVDRVKQILAEDEARYGAMNTTCGTDGVCSKLETTTTRRRT